MKKRSTTTSKRNIQQQTFNPFISCSRLRNIQSILTDGAEDTIVAVLGIDSRYNEGCRELANYLLFDFYDLRINQLEQEGIPDEDLDDLIIVIQRTSVAVYCSSTLHNHILPYVAHWKNLQIYSPPHEDREQQDESELEEFKIRSFISMLESSRLVGFPYYSTRNTSMTSQFNKFEIEKWPIIQAFALENIGGGGFFTLKHEVSNVHDRLTPVYMGLDPSLLERMIVRSLPLFESHWVGCMSNVVVNGNGDSPSLVNYDVTEDFVIEPMKSYFRHGRLSANQNRAVDNIDQTEPLVCFGSRTSDRGHASTNATIKNSGINGPALHMVMHFHAPKSPISCARTYMVRPLVGEGQARLRDFNRLVGLYDVCVHVGHALMTEVSTNHTLANSDRIVRDIVGKLPLGGDVEHKVVAVDNKGRQINFKSSGCLLKVCVEIPGIRSLDGEHEVLGSVVYSDTFVCSNIATLGGSDPQSNSKLVLTSGIPLYQEWQGKSEEMQTKELIVRCNNGVLCSNNALCDVTSEASLDFYVDGSILVTPRHAPRFLINRDDISSYELVDNEPISFSVRFNKTSDWLLPSFLSTNQNPRFTVVFTPHSPGAKNFKNKVVPVLKSLDCDSVKLETLSHPDDITKQLIVALNADYDWQCGTSYHGNPQLRGGKLGQAGKSIQPQLTHFMNHFGVSSSLGGVSVSPSEIPLLLEVPTGDSLGVGDSPKKDEKVVITVVTGTPGSHADKLGASIVTLHRERVRWVTIRTQCCRGNATLLDVEHLVRRLVEVVAKRRASRPGAAALKRLRVVVESIGYIPISSVVSCIVDHPDPSTRGTMMLGACTSCVDPLACFVDPGVMTPNLLEQVTSGIICCVAFTGRHDDLKDKNLAEAQSLIRAVNHDTAFLLAAGGKMTRTSDFDLVLSEKSFNCEDAKRTRILLRPGRSPDTSPTLINEVTLHFSPPLLRGSFSARLRSLGHVTGVGDVIALTGVVAFTDTPDEDNDVTFVTKTSTLELEPRVQSTMKTPAPPPSKATPDNKKYHLKFYGKHLNEDKLKCWLRMSGQQKPSRKCRKTRTNISKAEIKMIQATHETAPLPDGIYFNGTHYSSLLDNQRSYQHPCLEEFISEYLKQENQKIDSFNKKIENRQYKDLFE
ncbi:dynein axonemal assembly factor 9 [Ciona intestinalis]